MSDEINHYTNKTILITGASGFIGSSMVRMLSRVDCRLVCLISGSRDIELPSDKKAHINIFKRDIASPSTWDGLIENVDIIFHFAAQTSATFANENPVKDLKTNLIPVARLLEICRKTGRRPDIVFSGTVTQAGLTTHFPVDEQHCDDPITIYDINKLAGEKYLQYYAREMGGRAATLRLANVYGPGSKSTRPDRGILNMMVMKALSGMPLTVYGDGNYIRDYVFIDDVINAFLIAGTHMSVINGKYYLIGNAKGYRIKEMAETVKNLVEKISGQHVEIKYVPVPEDLSAIEFRHFVADSRRFRMKSGWIPKVKLEEGIERTIRFFRRR